MIPKEKLKDRYTVVWDENGPAVFGTKNVDEGEYMVDAMECLKCGDVIYSRHRHDYRRCKCLACAIDGGRDYTRMIGHSANYAVLKIVINKQTKRTEVL